MFRLTSEGSGLRLERVQVQQGPDSQQRRCRTDAKGQDVRAPGSQSKGFGLLDCCLWVVAGL